MAALSITDVTVYYRDVAVLSHISVSIAPGSMVGIIGPNGAGKTTFLKALLGLIPVTAGTIIIHGSEGVAAHKKIGYIPQNSTVDWDFPLTVADMVLMGCYGRLGWFARPTVDDYRKVQEALAIVGLDDKAHDPIGVLSGGQRQRAFIARALVQDPQVYLLDEPFAGVDVVTEQIIVELFKKLCTEGKTVIVVHHDLFTAPLYFTFAVLLNKRMIAAGPIKEVLTAENVGLLYGGSPAAYAWFKMIDEKEPNV
jgi:manganese/zinc/iron transport system ATP- binding protein